MLCQQNKVVEMKLTETHRGPSLQNMHFSSKSHTPKSGNGQDNFMKP